MDRIQLSRRREADEQLMRAKREGRDRVVLGEAAGA
jgi:hypothetical protein